MRDGQQGFDSAEIDDLRDIVRSDVEHLRTTWLAGMDSHVLRREAVTLRRLLVDNGGDLARLWRLEGRAGQPAIVGAWDLSRFPTWRGLAFGTADTLQLPEVGLEAGGLFMWREDLITEEVKAVLEDTSAGTDPVPLRKYVEGVCIVTNEKPIRRVDLITYIANNRGGAHFDPRGRSKDPRRVAAWELLHRMRTEGHAINEREAAFGQLVAMAHTVTNSPDVQNLIV